VDKRGRDGKYAADKNELKNNFQIFYLANILAIRKKMFSK
jgi:hypothetical protein